MIYMKRIKIENILSKVAVPLAMYIMIGLFALTWMDDVNRNEFLVWSVVSGAVFALKDIMQNKIVTYGIWTYVLGMVVFLVWNGELKGSSQAVIMLISIVAIAMLRWSQKYVIVSVCIGCIGIFGLVFMTVKGYEVSRLLVSLSVFSVFYAGSELIAMSEKRSFNNKSLIWVYSIIAILTFWAPVSAEPYGWDFVHNIKNAIQETVRNLSMEIDYQWGKSKHNDIFRVSFVGYSDEEDALKNSIKDSNTPQLGLEGKRTQRNLYLKGNVANTFSGDSWSDTLEEESLDITTEVMMTMYAIYAHYRQNTLDGQQDMSDLYIRDSIQRFVDSYHYQITFKNLKSRSLFYPVKTTNISEQETRKTGDNLQLKKVKERGYSYDIEFIDLDYANPLLVDIMQDAHNLLYDENLYYDLCENLEQYFDVKLDEISFEQFLENVSEGQKRITSVYATVDESVSESVYELANVIVQNCENDYQKCKALENFLYRYPYNKIISIPEHANVLDWFLFDGMEGYCTHFATALVEMLRCVGIPARVAEGFLVDYSNVESYDSYTIMAQRAHAWTEAYMEGFGWIRLDATGSSGEDGVWYPEDFNSEIPDSNVPELDETIFEEEFEKLQKEEELRQEEELIRKEEEKRNWMLASMLIAGIFLVAAVIAISLVIFQKIKIRRSSNPNVIFEDIMKLLKRKYREKEDGETLKEYFGCVVKDSGFVTHNGMDFMGMVRLLELYWYGDAQLTGNDIEAMRKIRNELKDNFQKDTRQEKIKKTRLPRKHH